MIPDLRWYDITQVVFTEKGEVNFDRKDRQVRTGWTYSLNLCYIIGADGGSRTHTMFPSKDFESFTSAYSITSAYATPTDPNVGVVSRG